MNPDHDPRTSLSIVQRYTLANAHNLNDLAPLSGSEGSDCRFRPLLAIKGFPARDCVTVGELADQLQIAHHSAVGLVDRLALQNLVSREAGTEDRHHVYVKPAAHGVSILEQLATAHREELRRLASAFSTPLDTANT